MDQGSQPVGSSCIYLRFGYLLGVLLGSKADIPNTGILSSLGNIFFLSNYTYPQSFLLSLFPLLPRCPYLFNPLAKSPQKARKWEGRLLDTTPCITLTLHSKELWSRKLHLQREWCPLELSKREFL